MLRKLYIAIFIAALPFVFMRLFWRGFGNSAYWQRWRERIGFITQNSVRPCIWVHAVSVGEVRASVPLVNYLIDSYPDHNVYITTMTPTGSDQVRMLFGKNVLHSYVPYDLPIFLLRFINQIKPVILLVMETELWPNIFHLCKERAVPIVMVNVRLSEKSEHGYKKISSLVKATLKNVDKMVVQTEKDAERLRRFGAEQSKIVIVGNIKFDIKLDENLYEASRILRAQWGQDRCIWLAASTHEGEDELVLKAYEKLKQKFKALLLVIVPRHPERFNAVIKLCKKLGNNTVARSVSKGNIASDVDIIVGDTMGELQLFYAACDVAFIGGSLVPVGGHNLLEASVVGKPTIFGPYMHNFSDISALVKEHGAGIQIDNVSELVKAVSEYLSKPELRKAVGESGRRMVEENRGALEKTIRQIELVFRA